MSKTVMIVEDNELNMKLFHDLLEAYGYHPIGTRNGIEALDFARKHRPDLTRLPATEQTFAVVGTHILARRDRTAWLRMQSEANRSRLFFPEKM